MDDSPGFVRAMPAAEASGYGSAAAVPDLSAEVGHRLLLEGRLAAENAELFGRFCEQILGRGVPLDRGYLHLRALHPQYRGVSRIWKPGEPLSERFIDYAIEKTATYIESPVRVVVEQRQRLEWRLDNNNALPFATLEELREQGYSHYVIAPLPYATAGLTNALSWATRRPGGFTAAHLHLFDALLPVYGTLVEAKALWRFSTNMLTTYVGREPARFIL